MGSETMGNNNNVTTNENIVDKSYLKHVFAFLIGVFLILYTINHYSCSFDCYSVLFSLSLFCLAFYGSFSLHMFSLVNSFSCFGTLG